MYSYMPEVFHISSLHDCRVKWYKYVTFHTVPNDLYVQPEY